MPLEFSGLYRKKGFVVSLEILFTFDGYEKKETDFLQALKDNESYPVEFYRVKRELLSYGLIAYKFNINYEKMIYLTEKGVEIYRRIKDLENFFLSK